MWTATRAQIPGTSHSPSEPSASPAARVRIPTSPPNPKAAPTAFTRRSITHDKRPGSLPAFALFGLATLPCPP